jgi:small subunit ribosomal protein S7
MARRKRVYDKPVHKDARYDSELVAHLIARVMQCGKKSLAERIVYAAIDQLNEKADSVDPLELFNRAIENAKPKVEVKARRVGGATYQVPVEVPSRRARTLAVRWLVDFARNRTEYSMSERLANEIMDATKQQGNAYKRKDDIFRMAQANKAFAHYRW